MELIRLTKEIAEATSISILNSYDEDEITDAGFEWICNGVDYHVQIVRYETQPYLVHASHPNGSIQLIKACHDVTELIIAIREITNS